MRFYHELVSEWDKVLHSLSWNDSVEFSPDGEIEGLYSARNCGVEKEGEGGGEGGGIGDEGRGTHRGEVIQ